MIPLIATYRLQMRNGVTFDAARAFLPHLRVNAISHLYLSPIFAAQAGSTHGYDVIDPNLIEPALGGEAGFVQLAKEAHAMGIGIILDIVPNHTAFSLENPWLRDVMRHGPDSIYAPYFDIDWSERLVLPFLTDTFDTLLADGRVGLAREQDGAVMTVDNLAIPLSPATTATGDLASLHDAQAWQLTRWERERDSITHRRFFNITGLIGMRVEDPAVFDDMHRKVFDLIDRGLVQGLRLDHIDGLADPAAYLKRLQHRVGAVLIWVEKILTGDEELPGWGIAGTTGYEAARQISRSLTNEKGHARLLKAWQADTGRSGTFHDALIAAKQEVIRQDLAAEMLQLVALADAATRAAGDEQGSEALREAVIALLVTFPRYRSYFADGETPQDDVALMIDVAERAAADLRTDTVVNLIRDFVISPTTPQAAAFRVRFQQVTGALLAKSHEDTAGFRWNAYLAANEVGADPDDVTLSDAELQDWMNKRNSTAMTLTSSHDTKRSEDARMRLVACSHHPDDLLDLVADTGAIAGADLVRVNAHWYLTQTALAIWDPLDSDLDDRLNDHMIKAMREAMVMTNWTYPDIDAEARVLDLVPRLTARWRANPPAGVGRLVKRGKNLSLIQTALKILMPGVPDIYRGCLGPHFALTDPDNRRPVNLDQLLQMTQRTGFAGQKARLSQALLAHRRAQQTFFAAANCQVRRDAQGIITLTRQHSDLTLTLRCDPAGRLAQTGSVWPADPTDSGVLTVDFG